MYKVISLNQPGDAVPHDVAEFDVAADALVSLGPHFTHAFRGAINLYIRFYDMAEARGIL